MLFKGVSKETILRIVGDGAAWPESPDTRKEFLNEINLKIEAASTGRPNRGLEISNFRDLAPLLMQAGANPVALVEEGVRRLDDRLDLDKFFPLIPSTGPSQSPANGNPEKPTKSSRESDPIDQQKLGDRPPRTTPPGVALAG